MKKINSCFLLLFVLICALNSAYGQFILEHEYPNSIYSLEYINFQLNGEKYVRLCYPQGSWPQGYSQNPEIDIYNLNHSLWKSISLSSLSFVNPGPIDYAILYVSDGLFNTDSLIEFMYTTAQNVDFYDTARPQFTTFIYNENMELLFSDSTAGPDYAQILIPESFAPIVNTSEGTKMILSCGYPSYKARVYGLAGTYAGITQPKEENTSPYGKSGLNLFPNPANNYTTVQYQLPDNVSAAQLVFYNLSGQKVKSFTVDHTFSDLRVSTADLSSGTYYCQIETSKGALPGKKLVKIN